MGVVVDLAAKRARIVREWKPGRQRSHRASPAREELDHGQFARRLYRANPVASRDLATSAAEGRARARDRGAYLSWIRATQTTPP